MASRTRPGGDDKCEAQKDRQQSDSRASDRVKPIVQSYSVTPSFARIPRDFQRSARPTVFPQPSRSVRPPIPRMYAFASRATNHYSRYGNPYFARAMKFQAGVTIGSKPSSKVWIRPAEAQTSSTDEINRKSTVVGDVSLKESVPSELQAHTAIMKTEGISNHNSSKIVGVNTNTLRSGMAKVSLVITPTVHIRPTVSSGHSGPMQPIVSLNSKIQSLVVKSTSLDKRYKSHARGFDIARKTVIAGLNLSQRQSTFTAFASRKSFLNTSFRIKPNPYSKTISRKGFIIRQYSMKRIRKSSLKKSPVKFEGSRRLNTNTQVVHRFKNERRVSKPSIMDGEPALSTKLELSSLSFSQTPSVRLATRVVKRSRQHLASAKKKKFTFCIFYNRFGTCKRMEEGTCSYVHDRRQLQVCSKFLLNDNCDSEDCKLSHDVTVGKIPPCRFFNEGTCSRESCPFLHIHTIKKLRPNKFRRKSSQIEKIGDICEAKESDLIKNNSDTTKSDPHEKTEEKNRYFETSPDSQPIVSIIPRRYPKGVVTAMKVAEDKLTNRTNESSDSDSSESTLIACDDKNGQVFDPSIPTSLSRELENGHRRQRLLGKLSKLKTRDLNQIPNKAPSFLRFNPRD